jgi:hypothetical protein
MQAPVWNQVKQKLVACSAGALALATADQSNRVAIRLKQSLLSRTESSILRCSLSDRSAGLNVSCPSANCRRGYQGPRKCRAKAAGQHLGRNDSNRSGGKGDASQRVAGQVGVYREGQKTIRSDLAAAAFRQFLERIIDVDSSTQIAARRSRIRDANCTIGAT